MKRGDTINFILYFKKILKEELQLLIVFLQQKKIYSPREYSYKILNRSQHFFFIKKIDFFLIKFIFSNTFYNMGASSSITNIPIYYSFDNQDLKYNFLQNLNNSVNDNAFINIVKEIEKSKIVIMCITNDIIRRSGQLNILNQAMDLNIPILFINLQDNLPDYLKNTLIKMGINFTLCSKETDIEKTIIEIQKTLIQIINPN